MSTGRLARSVVAIPKLPSLHRRPAPTPKAPVLPDRFGWFRAERSGRRCSCQSKDIPSLKPLSQGDQHFRIVKCSLFRLEASGCKLRRATQSISLIPKLEGRSSCVRMKQWFRGCAPPDPPGHLRGTRVCGAGRICSAAPSASPSLNPIKQSYFPISVLSWLKCSLFRLQASGCKLRRAIQSISLIPKLERRRFFSTPGPKPAVSCERIKQWFRRCAPPCPQGYPCGTRVCAVLGGSAQRHPPPAQA